MHVCTQDKHKIIYSIIICNNPKHETIHIPISSKMDKLWIAAMKLKDPYSLEGQLWPT